VALKLKTIKPSDFINPLLSKKSVEQEKFERFQKNFNELLHVNKMESEEHQKNAVRDFLTHSFSYEINTKARIDWAIFKNSKVEVLIEAKRLDNFNEMVTKDDLNRKAFHEAVLYFMQERAEGNIHLKHIIILTAFSWFIFDAKDFERLFWQNKQIKKIYTDFKNPSLLGDKTKDFYENLSKELPKFQANLLDDLEIECAYFNLQEPHKPKDLLAIYKLLSADTLLKEFNPNDANSLNREFYNELLYILGLEETKQGSKKVIAKATASQEGSFYENIANKLMQYGISNDFETIIKLIIIWINRILFLKLLESQIVAWNKNKEFKFLHASKINDYDKLEMLFFEILAKRPQMRKHKEFDYIPYLNSSLFEIHEYETKYLTVSNLEDDAKINYYPKTVLKDEKRARKSGQTSPLAYLFEFLDAYDFGSTSDAIANESKSLINASVLGLIFEKINGYKDGSFYTPSFITMYMARESLQKSILERFNAAFAIEALSFEELKNYCDKHSYKTEFLEKANKIIDSITVCDPAVGSGHFLVSVLNEIIYIKHQLGLFNLRGLKIELINDELLVKLEDEWFEYTTPKDFQSPNHKVQKMLFLEKQRIIENQLFGVDINPNSSQITKLRLWIELLKNSYYDANYELVTLPNIDINIKTGNSLISRFDLKDEIKMNNVKQEIKNYKQRVKDYKENLGTKKEVLESIENLKNKFRLTLKAEYKVTKERNEKLREYVADFGHEGLNDDLLLTAIKNRYGHKQSLFGDTPDTKKQTKLLEELAKLEKQIDEIEKGKIYEDAFEWRFEFPEVLDEDGNFVGFDIVIGNPPYGAELSTEEKDLFKTIYHNVHMRTPDTFNYFISKSMSVIKDFGRLSFIVPNNLLFQNEFEKTRELLLNQFLNQVINFGDGVFVDASVPTAIFEFSKQNMPEYSFGYLDLRNSEKKEIVLDGFELIKKSEILKVPSLIFGVNTKAIDTIEKVKEKSYLIDEIALEVASGISTGGDKIFRVDEKTINEYNLETDILHDVLVGREINRYEINATNHELIYTVKSVKIDELPNIKNYLVPFTEKLSNKRETKNGILPWWCLHWARYKELFTEPKILLRQTADSVIATFDADGFFVLNSILVFKIDKKYAIDYKFALAVLNSKLTNFVYKNLTQEEGRGFAEVKPKNIRKLFIPKLCEIDQKPFIDLADQILTLKKENPHANTSELEAAIDELVYKLYDLSDEEIKIVEGER
jgi:hypothetical protein